MEGWSVTSRAFSMASATASGSCPSTARRMPADAEKRSKLIVGDGEVRRSVDRDLIVVEQHDQPAELEMAGEARSPPG